MITKSVGIDKKNFNKRTKMTMRNGKQTKPFDEAYQARDSHLEVQS